MVLFQGACPDTPWDFCTYFGSGKVAEIAFWMVAIVAIIFALFLLSSYLTTRKPAHLYWGISFTLIWINTHVAIFSGSFTTFLDPVPATLYALMVGLFAVGLFKNVKPEKDKMGNYLLYYVVIMSLVIGFFKLVELENLATVIVVPALVVPILVMILHVPSAILIIWLPLQTREENGISALAMTLAGVLMGLVGVLLALATLGILATDEYLLIVFNVFPFVYLGAGLCFAWGTFVPKRWNFAIPGIELED